MSTAKLRSLISEARELLSEHAMVGFRFGKTRVSPEVVARVKVCEDYKSGTGKGKVEVWISPAGKKNSWIAKLGKALQAPLAGALDTASYDLKGKCRGLVEIGQFSMQNSWSDDSYVAVRADTEEIARVVMETLKKVLPVSGGGVPGSTGYKGSGEQKQGDGEYVYHYSSFGIGS
jgi:hypothetical protein